jgi:hypothetical protein
MAPLTPEPRSSNTHQVDVFVEPPSLARMSTRIAMRLLRRPNPTSHAPSATRAMPTNDDTGASQAHPRSSGGLWQPSLPRQAAQPRRGLADIARTFMSVRHTRQADELVWSPPFKACLLHTSHARESDLATRTPSASSWRSGQPCHSDFQRGSPSRRRSTNPPIFATLQCVDKRQPWREGAGG